jgi:hypothetical protein
MILYVCVFSSERLPLRIEKSYIELLHASFHDFNSLAMSFLMHFQLPILYEIGTELLTSLRQTNSVHISDHIHEWR